MRLIYRDAEQVVGLRNPGESSVDACRLADLFARMLVKINPERLTEVVARMVYHGLDGQRFGDDEPGVARAWDEVMAACGKVVGEWSKVDIRWEAEMNRRRSDGGREGDA